MSLSGQQQNGASTIPAKRAAVGAAFHPGPESDSVVTLHVLDGRVIVKAAGESRELRRGQRCVVDPGRSFAIHSAVASDLRLTVYRPTRMASHPAPANAEREVDAAPLFSASGETGPMLARLPR